MATEDNISNNPNNNGDGDGDHNNNNNNNGGGNNELSNRPACAACKYHRKKCIKEECAMRKHFPAQKAEEFAAVQKIFGLKNLTSNIKDLDVGQEVEAMKSFEWEAACWKDDPVYGPLGQYMKLKQQCVELLNDCAMLRQQLMINNAHQALQQPTPPSLQSEVDNLMNHGCSMANHSFANVNHSHWNYDPRRQFRQTIPQTILIQPQAIPIQAQVQQHHHPMICTQDTQYPQYQYQEDSSNNNNKQYQYQEDTINNNKKQQ